MERNSPVLMAPQLIWSTFLNANVEVPGPQFVPIKAMALDSAGNVIVAGDTPVAFPTTARVVQPALPDSFTGNFGFIGNYGFMARWTI